MITVDGKIEMDIIWRVNAGIKKNYYSISTI